MIPSSLSTLHSPLFTIFLYLLGINAATFGIYWLDKYKARNNHWRIPESTLHVFALLGGTPAAFYAQRKLRHKTRKTSFQVRFWLVVVIQFFAFIYWLLGGRIF